MKTQEELQVLKGELESLQAKLSELSEEELEQVAGGFIPILGPAGVVMGSPLALKLGEKFVD